MALSDWTPGVFELSPDGTVDLGSFLDNSIRDLKEQIRLRLEEGGHVMQSAAGADDGLHRVQAGVAGSTHTPDVHKSTSTVAVPVLLVEYLDTLIELKEKLHITDATDGFENDGPSILTKAVTCGAALTVAGAFSLAGHLEVSGGQSYAMTKVSGPTTYNILDTDRVVWCDPSVGQIVLNLPSIATVPDGFVLSLQSLQKSGIPAYDTTVDINVLDNGIYLPTRWAGPVTQLSLSDPYVSGSLVGNTIKLMADAATLYWYQIV